ncbi:hypothetical protein XELAEV_18024606mg [Xenopus laevis]|uniref:Uncharacterized protein n=1 Tax=Xenopus laevis TaxID=8355 RepID=A0A974HLI5_XENLA|nr:hypothetical protein XELAEV_18024606mg [Xenopus laevis]
MGHILIKEPKVGPAQKEGRVRDGLCPNRGDGMGHILNKEPKMDPAQTEGRVRDTYRMRNHRCTLPRKRRR